jgi:hypothetical protein
MPGFLRRRTSNPGDAGVPVQGGAGPITQGGAGLLIPGGRRLNDDRLVVEVCYLAELFDPRVDLR